MKSFIDNLPLGRKFLLTGGIEPRMLILPDIEKLMQSADMGRIDASLLVIDSPNRVQSGGIRRCQASHRQQEYYA